MSLESRYRWMLASRFRAGDSVACLADDYGITAEEVEQAIRSEWIEEQAKRMRKKP